MQEIRRHLEFNWGEGATGQDRLEHLNQVEVTDVRKEGYQQFSNLLRRQRLPRNSLFVPSRYVGTISPRDPNRARVPFVSWEDLRCGGVLSVYGRRLFLHSCDASTLQWYRRQGVVQRPLQL
mmetsp:Transcript_25474/g.39999  ORF Transcript_25474/g.39999 Transcript_25474/m.39999 type:complete len:122 (+) Transcript_25474:440-805(+)